MDLLHKQYINICISYFMYEDLQMNRGVPPSAPLPSLLLLVSMRSGKLYNKTTQGALGVLNVYPNASDVSLSLFCYSDVPLFILTSYVGGTMSSGLCISDVFNW